MEALFLFVDSLYTKREAKKPVNSTTIDVLWIPKKMLFNRCRRQRCGFNNCQVEYKKYLLIVLA